MMVGYDFSLTCCVVFMSLLCMFCLFRFVIFVCLFGVFWCVLVCFDVRVGCVVVVLR